MGDILVNSSATYMQVAPPKPAEGQELSTVDELNVTVTDGNSEYKVSTEAQYIFDMEMYLNTLDDNEQDKTIAYFAKSNGSLDKKVASALQETQRLIRGFRDGTIKIIQDESVSNASKLLDPNFVMDGTTEIGVRPNGPEMFRMDGKKKYDTASSPDINYEFKKQLDELEKNQSHLLRNRDAANLFGSVNNAVGYAQNILLSADDVLHYNEVIAQAKKTIDFVTAPDDLKTTLTNLISQSIAWQNQQQSKFIANNRKYINNARVGKIAADAVRMGSAAQAFNQQLRSALSSSKISLLDAGPQIKNMLLKQPDLIRFSPDKIDEALTFYRNEDAKYDKALNRGFYEPAPPEQKDPWADAYKKIFDTSKTYALKVIGEIQSYINQ